MEQTTVLPAAASFLKCCITTRAAWLSSPGDSTNTFTVPSNTLQPAGNNWSGCMLQLLTCWRFSHAVHVQSYRHPQPRGRSHFLPGASSDNSPEVGSSANMIAGCAITPHAMPRRRFSPPDRPRTTRPPGSNPPTCKQGVCVQWFGWVVSIYVVLSSSPNHAPDSPGPAPIPCCSEGLAPLLLDLPFPAPAAASRLHAFGVSP
jgi:hypothetical protein